jgi:hypothetical protein
MILILFFNSHCDVILRLDRYQPNDSIATLHYASPADTELFSTKAMFTSLTNRRETSSCVNTVLSIFLPTFLLIGHKDQLSMWRISEMNKFYCIFNNMLQCDDSKLAFSCLANTNKWELKQRFLFVPNNNYCVFLNFRFSQSKV